MSTHRSKTAHLPVIRPCAGPCGRMTRPSKRTAKQHPDTVTRMDAMYCKDCFVVENPDYQPKQKEYSDAHIEYIAAGYRRWLEGRYRRLSRFQKPQKPPYVRQKATYQ